MYVPDKIEKDHLETVEMPLHHCKCRVVRSANEIELLQASYGIVAVMHSLKAVCLRVVYCYCYYYYYCYCSSDRLFD